MGSISRRSFLANGLALAGAGVGLSLLPLGCGAPTESSKTTDASSEPGACQANGTETEIGSNHGHVLSVPKSDVENGAEKTYDIQGTGSHSHSVTLSAADFGQLQEGQVVTLNSTNDSFHEHSVTVMCA